MHDDCFVPVQAAYRPLQGRVLHAVRGHFGKIRVPLSFLHSFGGGGGGYLPHADENAGKVRGVGAQEFFCRFGPNK